MIFYVKETFQKLQQIKSTEIIISLIIRIILLKS